MTKRRLWRVDITHQMGCQAPYLMIETDIYIKYKAEEQAIALAKQRSQLSNYDCWNFTTYCTGKKLRNGKWYSDAEIQAHKEKLEEERRQRAELGIHS